MRIFIAGGGHTAEYIARRLIREGSDLVIIEQDPLRCQYLETHLDARICSGSAASVNTWRRAGINRADMLIAVTPSDEINLIACLIVDSLAPDAVKAIQLRTWECDELEQILRARNVRVDLVIHPESVVVARILRVLMLPGVADVRDFASGRVKAFGMTVERGSPLVGKSIEQLAQAGPPANSMVAMILRSNEVRIPRADDVLMHGDHLYVVTSAESLDPTMHFMGIKKRDTVHQVFIVGGGELGAELAKLLEAQHIEVKIFEQDADRCQQLIAELKSSIVIGADGTDQEILEQENIEGVDTFIALTKDDEANMISSLLARHLGARKVIALVNRLPNLSLAEKLGINTTVSPRMKAVDHILRFIRGGGVLSVRTFRGEEAEAIELVAPANSRYVGQPLRKVHFPHGVIVVGILKSEGQVLVPRGDGMIEAGDRVVFFALEGCVRQLESEFLQPGAAG